METKIGYSIRVPYQVPFDSDMVEAQLLVCQPTRGIPE
jgi:hypothetical protein